MDAGRPTGAEAHLSHMTRSHVAVYNAAVDPAATTTRWRMNSGDPASSAAVEGAPALPPLPLDGIRVVDFTWIVAGPQATRILGDLGADVVKVENESYLDSMRVGRQEGPRTLSGSGMFSSFSRNKRSITANVHHPAGREVVERLMGVSDVVVENYSATGLEHMGFGWERLQEINPRLIYLSASGFGHSGRNSDFRTWGPSAQGLSGTTATSGLPDQAPAGWGFSYLDQGAGYFGAAAVIMALHELEETGLGQHIDLSQVECGLTVSAVPVIDHQVNGRSYERVGNHQRYPSTAPHSTYRCSGEDRWIAIAAESDEQWAGVCDVLGLSDCATDPRFATNAGRVEHQDELDRRIDARTRDFEHYDLMYRLQARGVPAGAAQDARDKVERDPQLHERGFYRWAPHPILGDHRYEGMPVHFSAARWRIDQGAPDFGEHTDVVLTDLLGYSAAEIEQLRAEAAI